jgi:hypothetical protein
MAAYTDYPLRNPTTRPRARTGRQAVHGGALRNGFLIVHQISLAIPGASV